MKALTATICILLFSATLWGQVNFTARANKTTVGQNERFTVEFKINAEAKGFQAPSFDGFRVLSGPNPSYSTYMNNSGISYNISYSYILQPTKQGTFTIGAASIKAEGETYQSKPLEITVVQSAPRSNNPNDPQNQAEDLVKLRALASKTSLYVGEPFVLSTKLYFRNGVGRISNISMPDYKGFYQENIEINHVRTDRETLDGQQYEAGVIGQTMLIPQQPGPANLGSVDLTIPVNLPTGRRDIFGRQLVRPTEVDLSARVPTITVKALPETGKPSDFSGAVGNYDMKVSLSRTELTADESITLKITVSGSGNIKLIDVPEPEIPNAFEVYDPKVSENISVGGFGMRGSKTYEYLLIPRYGGTYKIKPVVFSYFDPSSKSYKTQRSEEYSITVTGGAAQPKGQNGFAASEKEDVNFISKDILFIKTSGGSFNRMGSRFFASLWFYILIGGLLVLPLAFMAWQGAWARHTPDRAAVARQKASKKARKTLALAKKELDAGDNASFYAALNTALWNYFSDKFNIPKSQLSKENIREKLSDQQVSAEAIQQVLELMAKAEMARFTAMGTAQPQADYAETVDVITKIENQV